MKEIPKKLEKSTSPLQHNKIKISIEGSKQQIWHWIKLQQYWRQTWQDSLHRKVMKIKIIIMTMKKIIFKNREQERSSREKPIKKHGLKRHVRSDGLNRYTVNPLCLQCCVCGFNQLIFLHVCRSRIYGCPCPYTEG